MVTFVDMFISIELNIIFILNLFEAPYPEWLLAPWGQLFFRNERDCHPKSS